MISPNPKETSREQGLLLTLFLQVRTQTFAFFDGKVLLLFFEGALALNTLSPGVNSPTYPDQKQKQKPQTAPRPKPCSVICSIFAMNVIYQSLAVCLLGLLIYSKVCFLPLSGKVEGSV